MYKFFFSNKTILALMSFPILCVTIVTNKNLKYWCFIEEKENKNLVVKLRSQQESPPVWTQEAYCPPCSEYSFCCPILADPPPSWPLTPPADWPSPPAGWPPRLADPPSWLTHPPAGWPPPAEGWVSWLTTPLGMDKLTKWNYYLPVVLRTRAVTNQQI